MSELLCTNVCLSIVNHLIRYKMVQNDNESPFSITGIQIVIMIIF